MIINSLLSFRCGVHKQETTFYRRVPVKALSIAVSDLGLGCFTGGRGNVTSFWTWQQRIDSGQ
jgi:hypothetical protein